MATTRNAADLTNRIFGELTALHRIKSDKSGHARWFCQCKCGNEKIALATNLVRGMTNSCGCLHKQMTSKARKTHGATVENGKGTRLFQIWMGMKQRCNNPNSPKYKRYGGRGIKIADEWLKDFSSFHNWATKNGYNDHLTIDRVNNNGNYEPDNCQWITHEENTRKRWTDSEVSA